ncbi:probable serine/threonine-protein kinase DDB_G0277449 [Aquarana catesbeiana]|uniref:probable serine/threonine-protein kinase DDB_G0277449 n=1 Tax=Aquarana catesbeiana TaxID=8400 RepID=UPI003CC9EC2D
MTAFHEFYSELYKTTQKPSDISITSFLSNIKLPSLSKDRRDLMEEPFTSDEIREVIKNLKTGSAPGPDGLSVPYYKKFGDILAPHMAKFFNSKKTGSPMDPHLNTAFITVIPKPNKNHEEVENYRPISLINNDLKILTKILANRLASFIKQYVHKDQVVLASHTSTDEPLAVKIQTKNSKDYKEALNESHILKEVCTTPFCIPGYGTFQTKDHLFFIMECLNGGDLRNFLNKRAPLTIGMTRFLTAEIICGLQSLHDQGIVHQDIKPENILLDSSGHVRIADFGLSEMDVHSSHALTSIVGTPTYMAPEIYLEMPYGFAADYFSLGVIVYEMATGEYPFSFSDTVLGTVSGTDSNTVSDTDSDTDLGIGLYLDEVLANSICNQYPRFNEDFSMNLMDLIADKLLCKSPSLREMHVKYLQSHPFFNGVDWVKLKAGEVSSPLDMEKLPPMDLTTEMMMEEIIDPDEEELKPELSEEDQELYSGFSFTSKGWGEIQRP